MESQEKQDCWLICLLPAPSAADKISHWLRCVMSWLIPPPQWPLGMWFHQKVILSIMKLTYRPLSILQCSIIRFWSLWLNVFSETISVRDYTILQDLWEFSSLSFSMALSLLPGLRNVDYFLLRRRNACLDWLSESYWMCSICEPWDAHRRGGRWM